MKNLITSSSKVLKFSFVMIALASAPVFAGGNEKIDLKKNNAEAVYAQALVEMAAVLNEQEEIQNIYTPGPQIKIYDANFNLIKEVEISNDGNIEDDQIPDLMHQATEFMKFENTTYYVLNK